MKKFIFVTLTMCKILSLNNIQLYVPIIMLGLFQTLFIHFWHLLMADVQTHLVRMTCVTFSLGVGTVQGVSWQWWQP